MKQRPRQLEGEAGMASQLYPDAKGASTGPAAHGEGFAAAGAGRVRLQPPRDAAQEAAEAPLPVGVEIDLDELHSLCHSMRFSLRQPPCRDRSSSALSACLASAM